MCLRNLSNMFLFIYESCEVFLSFLSTGSVAVSYTALYGAGTVKLLF